MIEEIKAESLSGWDFKAIYSAEYHNIDGIGWPDIVVMENQGSVLDGTYKSKMYFPEWLTKIVWNKHKGCWECDSCGEDWGGKYGKEDEEPHYWNFCSNCGSTITEVVSDAD